MLLSKFNVLNQFEPPSITLCNPDHVQLASLDLDMIYGTKLTLAFNALSSFTFTCPKTDKITGITIPAYPLLKSRRQTLISDIGYFLITDVEEDMEGGVDVKIVTANSIESELLGRKITNFVGTYIFSGSAPAIYDSYGNPLVSVLMTDILNLAPNWTLKYIDPSIASLVRSFSVVDNTVYNFLTTEVSTAYACVFYFDYLTREISVYSQSNAITSSDIYLNYDNLIKSVKLTEKSDEIATGLYVYGKDPLNIQTVNPLGGNEIYNFSYYENIGWMSQPLIDALNIWEQNVIDITPDYKIKLLDMENSGSKLTWDEGILTALQAMQTNTLALVQVRISENLPYPDLSTDLIWESGSIITYNAIVAQDQTDINNDLGILYNYNNRVQFTTAFTSTQLTELNNYIVENTYTNSNFGIENFMSYADQQMQAQELFDQATVMLAKISQPRYEFTIDSINVLYLKEFLPFIQELTLGTSVTIDLENGSNIVAILLQIEYSLDDPSIFTLTFGNRLRLDDAGFIFSDLFGDLFKGEGGPSAITGTTGSIGTSGSGLSDILYVGPNYLNKAIYFTNGLYTGFNTI